MRAKHGAYDESRGLPDNGGKPTGSGLYVWLCSEAERLYGKDLIDEAQGHGDQRYRWLIAQIEAMPGDEAKQLVEEFHVRRKADAVEQRQAERRHRLAQMQAQIDAGATGQRLAWLEKEIQKVQRSIEKAAKQPK